MTLFKKIQIAASSMSLVSLLAVFALIIWCLITGNPVANNPLYNGGGLIFFICIIISGVLDATDSYVRKQPMSLLSLFGLAMWIAIIFFWLGMRFATTLTNK